MRVALLSYDFGEYCIRLASGLAANAEVLLLLPRQLAHTHLPKLDRRVRCCLFDKPRLRQPFRQLGTLHRLHREIRKFSPDVIHIQQGHLWFNFSLSFLPEVPKVFTIHDPMPHIGDRESRKTPQVVFDLGFRRGVQFIVHGQRLKEVVIDRLPISAENIHVIPHIVIGDGAASAHVGEIGNTVLFFGRIWPYKGLEHLIRAEPLITARIPDARIVIAGQGEEFSRYRQMMIHPEHFVVHNSYISDDRRAELFREASIVVLPYIEATQSGVIPVAYAFAKPVVATSVGGLPEMVEHGCSGYLVPPGDERALAEAIVRLLNDEGLRRILGGNGKRRLDAECSQAAVAHGTFAVYRRALGDSAAEPVAKEVGVP